MAATQIDLAEQQGGGGGPGIMVVAAGPAIVAGRRAEALGEGAFMSTWALAAGHGRAVALRPSARWGRAAVLAVLVAAGVAAVRPSVPAILKPAVAPAATPSTAGTWPVGLREAAEAALASEAYRFVPASDGTWTAATPAHGLRSRFGPAGPTVGSRDRGWSLDLSLARLGRPGDLVPVAAAQVVGSGEVVEYRRGPDVVEWYRNDTRGLEQGFDLSRPPAGGAGPLTLEFGASGLTLALGPGGEVLAAPAGAGPVLRYSGLQATDASGRDLPAWMEVDGQTLRLRIDDAGAAYPVAVDPWFQQAKLIASDAAAADQFGSSIAVSGDTAVVGAHLDDSPAAAAGSAYVFVRANGVWTQQQKLIASDALASDHFGSSVAVVGDTAVVGAPNDDSPADAAGSAYVFVRANGVWTQQQQLIASDALASDGFGSSVGVSGDTAVVGASADDSPLLDAGSAYVFLRANGVWTQQQRLTAVGPAISDAFGISAAVSGDTAVVGAHRDNSPAADAGSARVFVRANGVWTQQAILTASDDDPSDNLGFSVAISGESAVVGAPGDDRPSLANAGSAYVFVRANGVWTQQQKLTASDAAAGDGFGSSVAVSVDTAVVGAPNDDSPLADVGSAYVFGRTNVTWTQQQQLTASGAAAADRFGSSVAVSGATALVGARQDDSPAVDAGSAFAFFLRPPDTTPAACVWSIQDGPRRVDFAVSDADSGLAVITITTAVNIVVPVPIPSFTPGTTATVNFSAVKNLPNVPSQVAVVVTDVDGNQSSCT